MNLLSCTAQWIVLRAMLDCLLSRRQGFDPIQQHPNIDPPVGFQVARQKTFTRKPAVLHLFGVTTLREMNKNVVRKLIMLWCL